MTHAQEHPRATLPDEICLAPLHPEALAGLELFNAGKYFEAHEALETAWRDEPGPVRDLYRGILQVGVGYYHILSGNYDGAVKMLHRCRQWLDPFPDTCRGIDLKGFRQNYQSVEQALQRLGPTRISMFDQALFKPIRYSR